MLQNGVMTQRRLLAASILQGIAVVISLFGLFDPLEGGVALLAVGAILGAVWWLSRITIPRWYWGLLVGSVALAVLIVLVIGLAGSEAQQSGSAVHTQIRVAVWFYRAAVFGVVAGATNYLGRVIAAYRD